MREGAASVAREVGNHTDTKLNKSDQSRKYEMANRLVIAGIKKDSARWEEARGWGRAWNNGRGKGHRGRRPGPATYTTRRRVEKSKRSTAENRDVGKKTGGTDVVAMRASEAVGEQRRCACGC